MFKLSIEFLRKAWRDFDLLRAVPETVNSRINIAAQIEYTERPAVLQRRSVRIGVNQRLFSYVYVNVNQAYNFDTRFFGIGFWHCHIAQAKCGKIGRASC